MVAGDVAAAAAPSDQVRAVIRDVRDGLPPGSREWILVEKARHAADPRAVLTELFRQGQLPSGLIGQAIQAASRRSGGLGERGPGAEAAAAEADLHEARGPGQLRPPPPPAAAPVPPIEPPAACRPAGLAVPLPEAVTRVAATAAAVARHDGSATALFAAMLDVSPFESPLTIPVRVARHAPDPMARLAEQLSEGRLPLEVLQQAVRRAEEKGRERERLVAELMAELGVQTPPPA
jgi:hypothetical protein